MPKQFTLPNPNQIRGDQLAFEITSASQTAATPTVDDVTFRPPVTLDINGIPDGDESVVQGLVDVHNPTYPFFPEDFEQVRRNTSEDSVSNIPGWATWTEQQALDWYTTNVDEPWALLPDIDTLTPTVWDNNEQAIAAQMQDVVSSVINVQKRLSRMVLALRNKNWPNLEGS